MGDGGCGWGGARAGGFALELLGGFESGGEALLGLFDDLCFSDLDLRMSFEGWGKEVSIGGCR